MLVVAVALINHNNEILLAQRPVGKSLAGLWEFPGGKIDEGERPEEALKRELKEELDIEIEIENLIPLSFSSFAYQDFHLLMPLWALKTWNGEPKTIEHQALEWVTTTQLDDFEMPPADIPLREFLKAYLDQ